MKWHTLHSIVLYKSVHLDSQAWSDFKKISLVFLILKKKSMIDLFLRPPLLIQFVSQTNSKSNLVPVFSSLGWFSFYNYDQDDPWLRANYINTNFHYKSNLRSQSDLLSWPYVNLCFDFRYPLFALIRHHWHRHHLPLWLI